MILRSLHFALLLSTAALTSGCQSARGDGAEPQVRVVWLEHAGAAEMAATLETFLAQDASASGEGVRVTVKSDAATNSLLIRGSDEQAIAQILKLVSRLDVRTGS